MKKAVTIKTLAAELNLSTAAISMALNDKPGINPETKTLILKKAAERGYHPNIVARSLVKRSSNFVGVMIRDVSSIYGELYKSLNTVAREYGLNLLLYDTNNDAEIEKSCIRNLIETMAMGVIIAPVTGDAGVISRMTKGKMPVVFIGGRVKDASCNYVCTDSGAGARMAVQYLQSLGHKHIALITDHKQSESRSSRVEAYCQKMLEIGEPSIICYGEDEGDGIIASGYQAGQRLLTEHPEVTGIFVAKDIMAIGVMKAIGDAGLKMPEDISVVGYDGIDAAALPMIELTSVTQPRMEMAERIIDILRHHASDPSSPPEHYLARPELVVRKSSGAYVSN